MPQSKLTILVSAALLFSGVSQSAQASDISIFTFSPGKPLDLSDPLMQVVPSDPVMQAVAIADDIDVWGRIRQGFAIPDLDNPLVTTQTTWYSTRPDYIQRTTVRGSRYLYHVVQELEKRHMPTELALLPFIESAFNPQAYSSAKAAGMWQFIPSTGLDYNLKQNIFRDDRKDVLASTDAALTYLQKLYGMFGDWQLALAAYNWGEGSVQRAIKKARADGEPITFNGLSRYMPAETRNYVPKLQAVKNIIANPDQYGITLPKVNNQPYFVTVNKTRDIDVKIAAQLAELPMEEFRALNPQYNRPVITGSTNTQILLPKTNADKFKENLANWKRSLSSWTAHKITNTRERIETLAAKFKTTPEVIREANNIPPKMLLKAGSTVLVPRDADEKESNISLEVADNAKMSIEPDVPDSKRIMVKVGKNDTLASIAKRNKVSAEQIKVWNKLGDSKLARGQSLELHVPYGTRAKTAVAKKQTQAKPARQTAQKNKKASEKKTATAKSKSSTTKTAAKSSKPRTTKTVVASVKPVVR